MLALFSFTTFGLTSLMTCGSGVLASITYVTATESIAHAQSARPGFRWETHQGAKMRFELPSAWTTTTDGDVLTTRPIKSALGLEFMAIPHGAAEASKAEETLAKAIKKRIPDAKTSGPSKPVAQNGLSGVVVRGEGTKSGHAVEWFSVVLGDGKGHGLLAVGFAKKGELAEHSNQLTEIFNSIRPLM